MKDQTDFLRHVQRSGWLVESADEESLIARCPAVGCGLRVKLKAGAAVPSRDCGRTPETDIAVEGFEEARKFLRQRRRALSLTILETEIVSGIATDHLAKFERDDGNRLPNAQTFFEWAQALGYQVVLRPVDLPPITLRMISETRPFVEARQKRFEIERQRGKRSTPQGSA